MPLCAEYTFGTRTLFICLSLLVRESLFLTLFCFYCASRQSWHHCIDHNFTSAGLSELLNSVHHLQPKCLEDRFLPHCSTSFPTFQQSPDCQAAFFSCFIFSLFHFFVFSLFRLLSIFHFHFFIVSFTFIFLICSFFHCFIFLHSFTFLHFFIFSLIHCFIVFLFLFFFILSIVFIFPFFHFFIFSFFSLFHLFVFSIFLHFSFSHFSHFFHFFHFLIFSFLHLLLSFFQLAPPGNPSPDGSAEIAVMAFRGPRDTTDTTGTRKNSRIENSPHQTVNTKE